MNVLFDDLSAIEEMVIVYDLYQAYLPPKSKMPLILLNLLLKCKMTCIIINYRTPLTRITFIYISKNPANPLLISNPAQ